jgi:glycosyltransferase involved in cell wall biosynthesis
MVVPNGVDLNEFAPSARSLQLRSGSILFSGLMSYYPNQHAVRWFLDKVFPLILRRSSDAKVVIAGASPPQWLKKRSSSQVEITGRVEDMRPFIEQGQVVIAPLLVGGGTRVKILEAQAMGKPVVSTSLGAEGLDLKDGESVLIADQADHFANRVVDVLTDSKLSWRIAHNGRNHAVQHFDWNRIGERLSAILQERIGLISRNELSRRHSSGAG